MGGRVEHLDAPLPLLLRPELGSRRQRRDEGNARGFGDRDHGLGYHAAVGTEQGGDGIGSNVLRVQTGARFRVASVVADHQLHRTAGNAPPLVQQFDRQPVTPGNVVARAFKPPGLGQGRGKRDGLRLRLRPRRIVAAAGHCQREDGESEEQG